MIASYQTMVEPFCVGRIRRLHADQSRIVDRRALEHASGGLPAPPSRVAKPFICGHLAHVNAPPENHRRSVNLIGTLSLFFRTPTKLRMRCPAVALLLLLSVLGCCGLHLHMLRMPWEVRSPRSMRSRLGGAAVRASESSNDGKEGDSSSSSSGASVGAALSKFFGTNRNTPEAQENQLAWAREQMDMEVPEATLDGQSLADRDDMVAKYIVSEKEKFGREIDQATAEAEVDEWLLKQATYAPGQTSTADLAIAATVFVAAFGAGIFFSK